MTVSSKGQFKKMGVVFVLAASVSMGIGNGQAFADTYQETGKMSGPHYGNDALLKYLPTLPDDGYRLAEDAYTGWEYEKVTKSKHKKTYWDHEADNSKNKEKRTVSMSVERSKYTSSTASSTGSLKAAVAEIAIHYETGWGKTKSVSTTCTYTIPAKQKHLLKFGSKYVKSAGYERYYNMGKLKKKRSIHNKWTYREYSAQEPI
ncbi:hypothetical protein M1K46_22665 [Fictibacillus sp. WQ 8-8]|uniref:hypothetical protein n=1 Tax=Fictibacillus sp. WQ 8-8 TaxID=2938788 RepID=UPI00210BF239|nr:hypothetical protein [Fictibacillus sp. WQ 8-8]MCQ6268393.1 hypothetical protein [Fictibacillus sp. WQ 8-8]